MLFGYAKNWNEHHFYKLFGMKSSSPEFQLEMMIVYNGILKLW